MGFIFADVSGHDMVVESNPRGKCFPLKPWSQFKVNMAYEWSVGGQFSKIVW